MKIYDHDQSLADFGYRARPSSDMRLSAWTATATLVARQLIRCPCVQSSAMTCFDRLIAASVRSCFA